MAFATIKKHRAYYSKYGRDRRARLRKEGKCTCCGRAPIPGKAYCEKSRRRNAVGAKGLSRDEKEKGLRLLDAFDGHCQCCGTSDSGKHSFHLDHKNGKVRGIICNHCNVALGYVRDNPATARCLAAYLERNG